MSIRDFIAQQRALLRPLAPAMPELIAVPVTVTPIDLDLPVLDPPDIPFNAIELRPAGCGETAALFTGTSRAAAERIWQGQVYCRRARLRRAPHDRGAVHRLCPRQ
jgi:hypothetical protein